MSRRSVLVRRGKTGGSGWVNQVCESNRSRVKTGQLGCRSGRVELTNIFQRNFFFFNYKKTNIKLKRLRKKSNSHRECKRSRFIFNFQQNIDWKWLQIWLKLLQCFLLQIFDPLSMDGFLYYIVPFGRSWFYTCWSFKPLLECLSHRTPLQAFYELR